MVAFTGVKVFSATRAKDREVMGEGITEWLTNNPAVEVVDKVITQSSDAEFHCLTITFFYKGEVVWNLPPYASKNGGAAYQQPRRS